MMEAPLRYCVAYLVKGRIDPHGYLSAEVRKYDDGLVEIRLVDEVLFDGRGRRRTPEAVA